MLNHTCYAAAAAPTHISALVPQTHRQLRPTLLTVAIHVALATGALLVGQTTARAQTTVEQSSQTINVRAYAISAGPLDAALAQFVAESGVALAATSELVQGRQSSGVHGTFSASAALDALLAGSGLVSRVAANNALVIEQAAQKNTAMTLPADVIMATEKSYVDSSSESVTGINLPLQETPQSVTVINASQIETQGLHNLNAVMDKMPGVSIESNGSLYGGYQIMYSRGSEIHNYTVDGMPVSGNSFSGGENNGIGSMSSAVYSDVTMVRGATGLMNGVGDPSGMIALTRKRPVSSQIIVSSQLGNDNFYNLQLDASSHLNQSQTVKGRGVISVDGGDSWVKRGDFKNANGYGVLEFELSDATVLGVGGEYQKTSSNALAMHSFAVEDSAGNPTQFNNNSNAATDWTNYNADRINVFADITHDFANAWQAKLQYSYTDSSTDQVYGVLSQIIEAGSNNTQLNAGFRQDSVKQHAIAANLKGSYSLAERTHDITLGLNHYTVDINGSGMLSHTYDFGDVYDFNGAFPKPNWIDYDDGYSDYAMLFYPDKNIKIQQTGLYTATRLSITDPLSIIVGARFTQYKNNESTVYLDGYEEANSIKDDSILTPYIGLTYNIATNLTAYASYTNIYNPQYYKSISGDVLPAEKGENYEVGLKSSWFDQRLAANVAVFHINKENIAVDSGDYTPSGDYAYNLSDGRGTGFEIELNGYVTENWRVHSGFTHLALKDSGRKIRRYIPEDQFKLFTTYALPVDSRRLTVGAGLRWQSKVHKEFGVNRQANTQKSYAVADVLAQYKIKENWLLGLNVDNIFNKSYRVDSSTHTYGAPRQAMLSMKYQY